MNTNSILFEKKEDYGILRFNRPEAYNAFHREMVDQLDRLLDDIGADEELGALIITGEKCFAAGANIGDMAALMPRDARDFLFADTFQKLEDLAIPTIAAINGYALGAGLELALCCDFRIAAEHAKMSFPEIGVGIMPGAGGTIRLPRLVGEARAKEMIYLGGRWDAEKALHFGLIHEIVSEAQLLSRAEELAWKLTAQPWKALRAAKKSIAGGIQENESELWVDLFATEDQKEGMRAFLEKRKPVFRGR